MASLGCVEFFPSSKNECLFRVFSFSSFFPSRTHRHEQTVKMIVSRVALFVRTGDYRDGDDEHRFFPILLFPFCPLFRRSFFVSFSPASFSFRRRKQKKCDSKSVLKVDFFSISTHILLITVWWCKKWVNERAEKGRIISFPCFIHIRAIREKWMKNVYLSITNKKNKKKSGRERKEICNFSSHPIFRWSSTVSFGGILCLRFVDKGSETWPVDHFCVV